MESRRDGWTSTSPETFKAKMCFQGGCSGKHTTGNISKLTPENIVPGEILQVYGDVYGLMCFSCLLFMRGKVTFQRCWDHPQATGSQRKSTP